MEILELAGVAATVFLAGVGQSAVGFGFVLFATPPLLWIGLPLPNVVALLSTCSLVLGMVGAQSLRASVPWRLVLTAAVVRIPAVIAGMFLLVNLVRLADWQIRMVIGAVLCALVLIQLVWRPRPVPSMHWGWAGLAFTSSGLIGGLCGMGGPPIVLWLMAHDWSPRKTRGFLFASNAASRPVHLALLWIAFGSSVLWSFAAGIALFPVVYLSARIGLPLGDRMDKERLRNIAHGILLIMGISAVIPGILALTK